MKIKLLLFIAVSNSLFVFSQNIAINTTGATNSSLSMLEILQISATANTKGLYVSHTGTIVGTGYGIYSQVSGTSTTNIAGYFSSAGATNNYAGIFDQGNVGIGTTAPAAKLEIDGSSGSTIKIVDGNQGSGKVLTSDASGQGSWQTVSGGSGGGNCFPNSQLFTATGASSVFAANTVVKIAVWGGGGGGGNSNGAGGGGGGYAEGTYTVTGALQVTIGAGGTGGACCVAADGNAGGQSCVSTGVGCTGTVYITASGGGGGIKSGGTGGAGGTGSGGYLNTTLGQGGSGGSGGAYGNAGSHGGGYPYNVVSVAGGNGSASGSGGGGGVGGGNSSSGSGSSAQTNSGAGGGGAYSGLGTGGSGAAGKVIIFW